MFSYSFDHKVTNIFTALHFIPDKNYSWPLNSTSLNYASLLIHRFFFHKYYSPIRAFQVALVLKNLSVSARDTRDTGSIPGSGRSPGEENGNPLQYSCLGKPMDRGAWRATVHGGHRRVRHDLVTKQQYYLSSSLDWKIPISRDYVCLVLCSIPNASHCLVHHNCSINICWVNKG